MAVYISTRIRKKFEKNSEMGEKHVTYNSLK